MVAHDSVRRGSLPFLAMLIRPRPHIGGGSSRIGLALLALCMVVLFQWHAGNFVTYANFSAILVNASSILLVAIAVARLLIAGCVDLSIGGSLAVIAVLCAMVARDSGSAVMAVVVAVGVGVVIGVINGLLVQLLKISPIIVTLGLLGIYKGIALVLTDAVSVSGLPETFLMVGRSSLAGVPTPVIVALVVFGLGGLALTRTVGGMRSYAVGGNPTASRYAGVNVDRHVLLLFIYVGVSVGLVAAVATARLGTGSPSLGANFEFDVLTAVILGGVGFAGGIGRPLGVFVGTLTISIVNAGMIFIGLTNFYQQIAKGAILLLALGADQVVAARRRRQRHAAAGRRGPSSGEGFADRPAIEKRERDDEAPVVLEAKNLAKAYGSVVAVEDVSFQARAGEVLCLVGDNGAGKSTVIKMLSGVHEPDQGQILLEGESVVFGSPAAARERGIETVHQDLALCPNLGAAYNLVVGREPRKLRLGSLAPLDRAACVADAKARLHKLNIQLTDYLRPVAEMSGGQRQAVAISRVVTDGVKVVILDEPTAALGVNQTDSVLRLARALADQGAAVIMITHDVASVLAVSDRVVVLSLGAVLFSTDTETLTDRDLVQLMAGLPLESRSPSPA